MKRIIRLTENDLARIVRRVINEGVYFKFDKNYCSENKEGEITFDYKGFPTSFAGKEVTDVRDQYFDNFEINNIGGRGFQPGTYKWVYSDNTDTGRMEPTGRPGVTVRMGSGPEYTAIFK